MEPIHLVLYGLMVSIVGGGLIRAAVFYVVAPIQKAAESIGAISGMRGQISEIVSADKRQAKTISALVVAYQSNARAMRRFAYALKKIGCNGEVSDALKEIDRSEDAVAGCVLENSEGAMSL